MSFQVRALTRDSASDRGPAPPPQCRTRSGMPIVLPPQSATHFGRMSQDA